MLNPATFALSSNEQRLEAFRISATVTFTVKDAQTVEMELEEEKLRVAQIMTEMPQAEPREAWFRNEPLKRASRPISKRESTALTVQPWF